MTDLRKNKYIANIQKPLCLDLSVDLAPDRANLGRSERINQRQMP